MNSSSIDNLFITTSYNDDLHKNIKKVNNTKIRSSTSIFDDNLESMSTINITVENLTYCNSNQQWIRLEIKYILFIDLYQFIEQLDSQTSAYISYAQDVNILYSYCQYHRIPLISLRKDLTLNQDMCLNAYRSSVPDYYQTSKKSIYSLIGVNTNDNITNTYFNLIPDLTQIIMSYLKHHHVQQAAYVYDNHEASQRLYRLLKLYSYDNSFYNFTFDVRSIANSDDAYALLYSIEQHYRTKDQKRYILLDLSSNQSYMNMFDKISHMGMTGDSYHYILMSTFDACSWLQDINFSGSITYFDYHYNGSKQECTTKSAKFIGKQQYNIRIKRNEPQQRYYYHSSLGFRNNDNPSSIQTEQQNETIELDESLCEQRIKYNNNLQNDTLHKKLTIISDLLPEKFDKRFLHDAIKYLIVSFESLKDCSANIITGPMLLDIINNKSDIFYKGDTSDVHINKCGQRHLNIIDAHITRSLAINERQTTHIGQYNEENGYKSCDYHKKKLVESSYFKHTTYYITSLFDEPFLMLRKKSEHYSKYSKIPLKQLQGRIFDMNELEGYCVDLADKICSTLNITCKFRIVHDGMIGELVSRTADMAIAPLTISQKRMEVVDFSKPFMNLGISIMIRKPDAEKPGVFSFMNPVSMEVWLCFSLAYFAISVILFLTSRVVHSGWRRRIVRTPSYRQYHYPKSIHDRRKSEVLIERQLDRSDSDTVADSQSQQQRPSRRLSSASNRRNRYQRSQHQHESEHQNRYGRFLAVPSGYTPTTSRNSNSGYRNKNKTNTSSPSKDHIHLFGISNALFFSFASFMRQSINLVPKSLSGRIAATSWWYFSLIFVSSYTANLVAFLTVEKLVPPIEIVEDLAKQDEIKYGSLRNGTTSAFFENSNATVFQNMWQFMQRHSAEVFVQSNDEGVAKVRSSNGKYAFFIESTKNEYVNERLPCNTMKVGSDLDSKGYGIATSMGSDLREAINIIVTELREKGFLENLKQQWWYERSECSTVSKDKRFSKLSLSSVTGLFYIFLFGVILSCVIAFTEFILTAKAESETLKIDFREMLKIKMVENLIGLTAHTQRQLEFGKIQDECTYDYDDRGERSEPDSRVVIQRYAEYKLNKPQSEV
ncbi:unnamed protein product [Didymodactylos carnosus]|uniref:Ionotropic glutamate receptor n=1 Tax=Didymodactylos carnosus TaxID=1234261 RepID=A0A813W1Z3_9BILA|nr:unnamed protein product [Didymodactylos carnosus]CAF3632800.1 unnamed protein product [Didymodactylos carnosus]